MRCSACGATTSRSICIFCGADDPRALDTALGITWGMRLGGLGCVSLAVGFLILLLWGTFRPGVYDRNQGDHPSLSAARELIKKRRYSSALDVLHKAPQRSALTADYRGLALLGMHGTRVVTDTTFSNQVSRAKEAFKEAIALDSELTPAYVHLAACQALLHEDKAAVENTVARMAKECGAYPPDPTWRKRLAAHGSGFLMLVETGTPFVILVGEGRPREGIQTINLDLGY